MGLKEGCGVKSVSRVLLSHRRFSGLALIAVLLLGGGALIRGEFASAASGRPRHAVKRSALAPPAPGPARWVAAWAASPQTASLRSQFVAGFEDRTIRNIVFSSLGGRRVRVRLSNAFGSRPLAIGAASVAVQGSGARLAAGTGRTLKFDGSESVQIPPGAEVVSDPVSLNVPAMHRVAISVFVPGPTGPPTEHGAAKQASYVAAGDHAADESASAFESETQSWYLVDDLDVLTPVRTRGTIVAIGDSITDGVGSTTGANASWPIDLARRLQARSGPTLNVVDEGIGGNRVLNDSPCCGVNAVARFDRDVLARTAAKAVILLEGVNDIGFSLSTGTLNAPHTAVSAAQIISGYKQIIAQAHTARLKIYGATITPFKGARYWSAQGEVKRDAVNRWILTGRGFDGAIDLAKALGDPHDPDRLDHRYDSGDHLHPNDAGYRAMADAVDLGALLRAR
jgi:lysophospholipase L1-like esterase